jgi:hypothetical protein
MSPSGGILCRQHDLPGAVMSDHQHPLPRGTRIVTLKGEIDQDNNDEERVTPPGAVGRITGMARERDDGSEGFRYDVEFENQAWIILEDREIDDPERYRVLNAEMS